jgi:hypothetical protein
MVFSFGNGNGNKMSGDVTFGHAIITHTLLVGWETRSNQVQGPDATSLLNTEPLATE